MSDYAIELFIIKLMSSNLIAKFGSTVLCLLVVVLTIIVPAIGASSRSSKFGFSTSSARKFYLEVRRHLLAHEKEAALTYQRGDKAHMRNIILELETLTKSTEERVRALTDDNWKKFSICESLADQLTILVISFNNYLHALERSPEDIRLRAKWVAQFSDYMAQCERALNVEQTRRALPMGGR